MNFLNLANLFLIAFCPSVSLAYNKSSISCYVCGPGENPNDCSKFNHSDANYTKVCSSEAGGCSTYYEGDTITSMACENYKFNVCRKANAIMYCYCDSSLCNGKELIKNSTPGDDIPNDDEDLTEGSGFQTETQNTQMTVSTLPSVVKISNSGIYLQNPRCIFMSSIILFSYFNLVT